LCILGLGLETYHEGPGLLNIDLEI